MGIEEWFKGCGKKTVSSGGCGGFIYFLAFIGALIYFWSTATNFLDGVLGFFKAVFWPAPLVYALLVFLGA